MGKYADYLKKRFLSAFDVLLGMIGIISALWMVSSDPNKAVPAAFVAGITTMGVLVGINHLRESIQQDRIRKSTKEKYPKLSIVGIIRQKRSHQTQWGITILSAGLLIEFAVSSLTGTAIDGTIITILSILALLLIVRSLAFNYRVQNGLYGSNEREAREIIEFVIKNAEKIDFTDGGKPKRMISDSDLAELKEQLTDLSSTAIPGVSNA